MAYLAALKADKQDPDMAMDLYGASVLHAYEYCSTTVCRDAQPLRSAVPRRVRPVQRGPGGGVADRLQAERLVPGTTNTIHTAGGNWDITCVIRGGKWRPEELDHFEFVSDYEITGLKNHYQTYGLGVPLIAVRRRAYPGEPAAARYYPPALSFPVTAFLRPLPNDRTASAGPPPGRHGTVRPAGDGRHAGGRPARCRWKAT